MVISGHPGGVGRSGLREYFPVLRRRTWIILYTPCVCAAAAIALSLQQDRLYEASSEVLIQPNLASLVVGTPGTAANQPAEWIAQTQADLARVPAVARRVARAARVRHGTQLTPDDFLTQSSVNPKPNSNVLIFTVRNSVSALASKLATEYARQFTSYRRQLDTIAISSARAELQKRMGALEALGERRSPAYDDLASKDAQLQSAEALQNAETFLIRPAGDADRLQPHPVRNGILGFVVGLVLGFGLAFLREGLDTRVRSAHEIGERLDLPLLARLPEPPRRLRRSHRLAMLADPNGAHTEPFRHLRTSLEFVNLEHGARSVMVSSALDGEGKSTTLGNLAVALARAGKRVILVDLDLRRPSLDRFFNLDGQPGVAGAALGGVALEEALVHIPIGDPNGGGPEGNGRSTARGLLAVMPAGQIPTDPGEFVGSSAIADLLRRLETMTDLVLVDAPPLLHFGDAIALSANVDALVVVTRLNLVSHSVLKELRRVLDSCPVEKLGFVLAAAESEEEFVERYSRYSRRRAPVTASRQRADRERVS